MSYSLNSFEEGNIGNYIWRTIIWVIGGDARSLGYSSYMRRGWVAKVS